MVFIINQIRQITAYLDVLHLLRLEQAPEALGPCERC